MPIPRLQERINSLVFKGTSAQNVKQVLAEYTTVRRAADDLKSCKHFVTVLEVTLDS